VPGLSLTLPKATSETRPRPRRWPSFDRVAKAFFEEKVDWIRRDGGTLTYITCQEQKGTKGRLVKNLTLRGSEGEPRSFPREEKSTSPTTLMYIRYRVATLT
jgi:hypothetical protein